MGFGTTGQVIVSLVDFTDSNLKVSCDEGRKKRMEERVLLDSVWSPGLGCSVLSLPGG